VFKTQDVALVMRCEARMGAGASPGSAHPGALRVLAENGDPFQFVDVILSI
jgi:hypothetical protein